MSKKRFCRVCKEVLERVVFNCGIPEAPSVFAKRETCAGECAKINQSRVQNEVKARKKALRKEAVEIQLRGFQFFNFERKKNHGQ